MYIYFKINDHLYFIEIVSFFHIENINNLFHVFKLLKLFVLNKNCFLTTHHIYDFQMKKLFCYVNNLAYNFYEREVFSFI